MNAQFVSVVVPDRMVGGVFGPRLTPIMGPPRRETSGSSDSPKKGLLIFHGAMNESGVTVRSKKTTSSNAAAIRSTFLHIHFANAALWQ